MPIEIFALGSSSLALIAIVLMVTTRTAKVGVADRRRPRKKK